MSDQEHIIRLLGENAAKAAKEYTDEITALRKRVEALEGFVDEIPGVVSAAAYGCGLDSRLAGIMRDTVAKVARQALQPNGEAE